MTLQELSREYRESGEAVGRRARELEKRLSAGGLTQTEALELRRRIRLLSAMARDTIATSRYLRRYDRKGERR